MFADFLTRLLAPAPDPLNDADARLALAALLVRLARSDGDYAPEERARITVILVGRYGLDAAQAEALRTEAEVLEAEAPDTVRFTRAIKDAVPHEARAAVIEALWQVALADGTREAHEDSLIRLVANLLGITDQESARARQKVARG
ncbi:TerB family tellurite resistance protein [Roseovarius autotrophicus]|uniref:tellurite resistance TerB family protein n=1 Tax=Roseovarius autotrophicus TaxID=2824121 RepID=UPI0019DAB7F8|nr:TerB family tellurite resistance protein [Roseovarius autotrophicus]MBE0452334.1 TerB family tellurite resistance protein [Roseovarius sp.]